LTAAEERNQNASLDITEGRAALERGELEQAVAKLRHALKLQPDSAEAQRYLGIAIQKQGENSSNSAIESEPSATQDITQLPENPPPPILKVPAPGVDDSSKLAEFEGYIREQKFQEVEPMLAGYVIEHPKSSWGWYAYGYTLFAEKKLGASIRSEE